MSTTIAVVNESTVVADQDVQDLVAVLQIQLNNDFYPLWGESASLIFVDKNQPISPGTWELVILDNSDQAGALGYHELTANGDPIGKVFAGDDIQFGTSWTVTASHELLEMMADPRINLTAEVDNGDGSNVAFFAYEICDACEDDSFGYNITAPSGASIKVSDFVTPLWFSPLNTNGPYDFGGHVSSPLQILQNGYISVFQVGSSGWTQLNGRFESDERQARSVATPGHRRHTRGVLKRSEWRKSEPK